ncbi:MAG TPA: hypothetical protein VNZ58_12900 [Thermomicrobiales bacterium]|nr:hypothetical protein [Thermomicrobiales bacterium]
MRTLFAILTGTLTATWLAIAGTATAQSTDINAIAEMLAPLSPKEIQTALHAPITDDQLPAGFSGASLIGQAEAESQVAEVGATDSVTYSVLYMPGGEPTPGSQTPSRASGPARLYNTASISYLIFDESLSQEDLAGFDDMLRTMVGDQATGADVQEISVAGFPAYLISTETETNGIPIVIDWVAVPVGKVVVIGMTMSGGESVDQNALGEDANALSIAAINHLQVSIEQRGTPAG